MRKTTDIRPENPTGDLVLQEVWRAKNTLSSQHGHDLDKLFAVTREREKHSGHALVNLPPKRCKV